MRLLWGDRGIRKRRELREAEERTMALRSLGQGPDTRRQRGGGLLLALPGALCFLFSSIVFALFMFPWKSALASLFNVVSFGRAAAAAAFVGRNSR